MIKKNNKAVFGIYKTHESIDRGINHLRLNGFAVDEISILLPHSVGAQDFIHTEENKASEGAAAGAGAGIILGGTLGLLVGIGAIAIPGLGPLIAAGPLMSSLAGLGIGSALGVLSGALIGYGIPEYEAKRYEDHLKEGGMLLSVHVDNIDWANKAKKILEATGAQDIAISTELTRDWDNQQFL